MGFFLNFFLWFLRDVNQTKKKYDLGFDLETTIYKYDLVINQSNRKTITLSMHHSSINYTS